MIQATVERMYTETEENRFLEVTYANGDKEVLYFKDFNSGAMIQNIVDRAKKMAIKDFLDQDQHGPADLAPAAGLRRRVQGERGPAQHHQPRRLGADLRQEGRADRVHPHPHHRQAGHRARPLDRHGRQHRPVPVDLASASQGSRPRSGPFACAVDQPPRSCTCRCPCRRGCPSRGRGADRPRATPRCDVRQGRRPRGPLAPRRPEVGVVVTGGPVAVDDLHLLVGAERQVGPVGRPGHRRPAVRAARRSCPRSSSTCCGCTSRSCPCGRG